MSVLRRFVSQNKVRYSDETYNLDLSYINRRIIAMGFPSDGFESVYRNPISEVSRFLDENHPGHYKIYNLSETSYSESLFNGPVEHYPFPDHHAPSFTTLLMIMKSMHMWLQADSQNIVVVHCIAGMGRTGTIICSLLQFEHIDDSASSSLSRFANIRTGSDSGVAHPSQIRYVHYVEEHLQATAQANSDAFSIQYPPPKRLVSVCLSNFTRKDISSVFLVVLDGDFDIIFNSSWMTDAPSVVDTTITFSIGIDISSDFTIKIFKRKSFTKPSPSEVLRMTLCPCFITGSTIVVPKPLLDGPHKDVENRKFSPDLALTVCFDSSSQQSISNLAF